MTQRFCLIYSILILSISAKSEEKSAHFLTQLYSSQSHILQHSGTQQEATATLWYKQSDFKLQPFLRSSWSHGTGLELRHGIGLGADYLLHDTLRLRAQYELLQSDLTGYSKRDSYGLIYNDYLDLKYFELNMYIETFYMPLISKQSLDSFFKIQAIKGFYFLRETNYTQSLYTFAQVKAKENDERNFGLSGQQLSAGVGYKYFNVNSSHKFSFLVEAAFLAYQSKNFSGDWLQIFAALQYNYE